MKNQKVVLAIIIVILLIIGGGVFIMSSGNKAPMEEAEQLPAENKIATMAPEEIGLDLTTTSDNKNVVIKIDKPQGIKAIEYELTWGAKVKDESSGEMLDVLKGTGTEDPIELNGKPYKAEIKMGTCSDVCHYDKGVNNIKIILKVTKTDGTVAQVEKSL